ncbi:hypothetical protein C0Q70_03821 [Pomacea canaliculata]|uniref:Uncharacterized protein n=1 Tax=Pomacea canaliculata TaxID=400727 RepID=A0A2T7PTS7_POMCA|nr:hypothetical protein C0Q70_03821 [Pomacea canaliculata]
MFEEATAICIFHRVEGIFKLYLVKSLMKMHRLPWKLENEQLPVHPPPGEARAKRRESRAMVDVRGGNDVCTRAPCADTDTAGETNVCLRVAAQRRRASAVVPLCRPWFRRKQKIPEGFEDTTICSGIQEFQISTPKHLRQDTHLTRMAQSLSSGT